MGKTENNQIVIDKVIDLHGCLCELPNGITLVARGGIVKNGILKGNMTRIKSNGKVFSNVAIKGSWNVPDISTNLFSDLSYENALRDVVGLSHPKVHNRIVIEKGCYRVKAEKNADVCIPICSNTDFILNGSISLEPNGYKSYDILQAQGENISIKGKGTIIGDKHTHASDIGEWGMGINLAHGVNTIVSGLTIKDCWGDCIYVGGNSKNVLIENCKLDHGRRQGISVTKADGVTIRNCKITNVGGTAPEYAIDLEPNANDTVDHILIENVKVERCKGGFLSFKGMNSPRTTIGEIVIKNCTLSVRDKYPICLKRSKSVLVEKCTVYTSNAKAAIYTDDVEKVTIRKNTINVDYSFLSNVKNSVRKMVGYNAYAPIMVRKAARKVVGGNRINEE